MTGRRTAAPKRRVAPALARLRRRLAALAAFAVTAAPIAAGPAAAQAGDTIAALTAAIAAGPPNFDLYQRRARLHFEGGDYVNAVTDLGASIAANPASGYTPERAAAFPTQTRENDFIFEMRSDVVWIRTICADVIGRRNPCPVDLEGLKRLDDVIAAAQVERY